MKRWLKVLWICILITFVAGVAITGSAIAMGARGNIYLDSNGLHTSNNAIQPQIQFEENCDEFSNIDIRLVSADLSIEPANTYGYQIQSFSGIKITPTLVNGKLSIVEETPRLWVFNFGFLNFLNWHEDQHRVTIYLPANSELANLNIQTVSSNAQITASNFKIKEFTYDSVSGYLDIPGQNFSVNNLSLKAVSGDVSLAATVNSQLSIDMVSGSATLQLQGNIKDYGLTFDRVSGSLTVNGNELANEDDWPFGRWQGGNTEAAKQISINLISGSVDLDFAS
jgi:DUF4097 and DUF4098 domain-containing protein YvlB